MYKELANQVAEMLKTKNQKYDDSFSSVKSIVGILYPNGVSPQDYGTLIILVSLLITITKVAGGEVSKFQDIAGYGILGMAEHRPSSEESSVLILDQLENLKSGDYYEEEDFVETEDPWNG